MGVYNGEAYLARAVESIRNQTFADWELIVVDDGSTDGTPDILQAAAHEDRRIRVFRCNENQGLTRSLIAGVAESRGRWIARQDADDFSRPDRLAAQVDWFCSHPNGALCGTFASVDDQRLGRVSKLKLPVDNSVLHRSLPFRNCFMHSSVMFSKRAYDRVGGYRPFFRYAQDYDLWCRLAGAGQLGNLPYEHVEQRLHDGAVSVLQAEQQLHFGAVASALWLAESAHRETIVPSEQLHDLRFHHEEHIDRACRRRYRLFVDLHRLGSTSERIHSTRWQLLRRGAASGDAGIAARCALYAAFGQTGYRWLRSRRDGAAGVEYSITTEPQRHGETVSR